MGPAMTIDHRSRWLCLAAGLLLTATLGGCAARPAEEASPPQTVVLPPPPPPPPPVVPARPSTAERVLAFDVDAALDHIRHLADTIGPRPSGSEGETAALQYAHETLASLGYHARWQGPVEVIDGRVSHNVAALHPAANGPGRLVVGAHVDTISDTCPGANDNASGVGIVLEVARCLREVSLPYELEFVIYGAEERPGPKLPGHRGSDFHLADHSAGETPIVGMISVDMVGAGGGLEAQTRPVPGGNPIRDAVGESAERLGLSISSPPCRYWSDHLPYAEAGIPHVWLWRRGGAGYHTPADRYEGVKPEAIEPVGRLVTHLLLSLDEERLAACADAIGGR